MRGVRAPSQAGAGEHPQGASFGLTTNPHGRRRSARIRAARGGGSRLRVKRNQSSPTDAVGRTRRPSGAGAVVGNGERKTIVTRLVAAPAPGLVGVERADLDRVARERSGAALDQTLGPCGRAAAAVADGLELVDEFGTGPSTRASRRTARPGSRCRGPAKTTRVPPSANSTQTSTTASSKKCSSSRPTTS